MEHELILAGCTPTPLAHYLKALGVFRLVAEQLDPDVRACWRKDTLVLISAASRDRLEHFFLNDYQPTPILSPWNGRAGYLEGDNEDDSKRRGAVLLNIFRSSTSRRLKGYRDLINFLDGLPELSEMNSARSIKKELENKKKLARTNWSSEQQSTLTNTANKEVFLKNQIFTLLRNALPDNQLGWIDAVVTVGQEKAFAPLLGGSGGVEGSMDLGVNFMDNLLLLIKPEEAESSHKDESTHWLNLSLFDENTVCTASNTAGSLAPGRVGGHNATNGFTKELNINPWDYILMLEGALAFRPSLTRKLESLQKNHLSYPFTVKPTGIGGGAISLSDENLSRPGSSEIWAPLWSSPASFQELEILLREGAIRNGRKSPRDGLDMAQCIAKLGTDRGLTGFQRFQFIKRSGDNSLAVPLSRQDVTRTINLKPDLISDLERGNFLASLRKLSREETTPTNIKRAISLLENALFSLTIPGSERIAVQQCLIRLGEVVQVIARSFIHKKPPSQGKNNVRTEVPPLPSLRPHWITQSDDGSAEFRLALALSGLHDLPAQLAPVAREKGHRHWSWNRDSRSFVWGSGDPVRNLAHVVERRLLDAQREGDDPFSAFGRTSASLAHVDDFLSGRTDDARLAGLLLGLIWTRLPEEELPTPAHDMSPLLPAPYAVLKPFFTSARTLNHLEHLPEGCTLPLPGDYTRLLLAGRIDQAIARAWQRGRVAGLNWPAGAEPVSARIDGPRLLAALAIPLTSRGLRQLLPRAANSEATTA